MQPTMSQLVHDPELRAIFAFFGPFAELCVLGNRTTRTLITELHSRSEPFVYLPGEHNVTRFIVKPETLARISRGVVRHMLHMTQSAEVEELVPGDSTLLNRVPNLHFLHLADDPE